ncbi:exported minor pilin protein [Yersinia intermedia]|jgi:type 1 fimbria pilin|uniref:fimbrial protein n=1 Tax=Yersinia intermedia TaxID=631 RepID=UPI0005E16CFF|nr:fimbrial protein [Yersinia intermedia]UZM72355.1 type 1 fimbrial protein [Yersinia intermedia]CNC53546.1 exported minor pilin protein [Yersinia intermedia]CNG59160.1 exported minor pilin protein [Yersinia intermedia]
MYKKISSSTLFLLLNLCVINQACSTQAESWGRVNMVGAIIEAACAIGTNSDDQTINLGPLHTRQIIRDGQSRAYPFSIRFVNCILAQNNMLLADWRLFQITFDGQNDTGLFAVKGKAKGIALQITDSQGNIAIPGTPLPLEKISSKETALNYSLRLVSNHKLLRSGEYTSTVKFKVDYY